MKTEEPLNYDPPQGERMYYRSTTTGDRAYLVRREGKDHIRLDRPMEEIIKPFRPNDWVREETHAPLARAHIVQVAFEADKRLCPFLGLHTEARKEWLSLTDGDRIQWLHDGPKTTNVARRNLWKHIMKALEPLTE